MLFKSRFIRLFMRVLRIRSVNAGPRPRSCRRMQGLGSTYKEDFIEFIAQKRNIDIQKAGALITKAEKQFLHGWGGNEYRRISTLLLEALRPIYDDSTDKQAIETYKLHEPIDFLRMVSYSKPTREDMKPIIERLASQPMVSIVDYGCGLAQRTIALSRYLLEQKIKVRLYLVDIRRGLHLSFLDFLCGKYGINYEFIEVTFENLYPSLPEHDYCDNVSVLEHIREPVTVVNNIDRALRPGGLFLALVDDSREEMMHISSNLKAVRNRLVKLGYQKIATCCSTPLFQKPSA